MDLIKCNTCKIEKPREAFNKNKARANGLTIHCKSCGKKKIQAWRESVKPVKPVDRKICTGCKTEKPSSDFGTSKESRDGLQSWCNECKNALSMKSYVFKTEVWPEGFKRCTKCKELLKLENFGKLATGRSGLNPCCRKCQRDKEIKRHGSEESYLSFKAEATKSYRKKNKHKRNAYEKRLRKESLSNRLEKNIRGRIWFALRKGKKCARTRELLGCSIDYFKTHIEAQFQPGMTWDNYGPEGWHIDHIYPCAAFDLSKPEEQKKCFNYSNMQPLWAKENMKKHHTVKEGQPEPLALSYD